MTEKSKRVHKRVWSLWDNIKDMAHDLNVGVKELMDAKYSGEIPAEQHDGKIITKSLDTGRPLKVEELRAYRLRDRQDSTDRRQKIADFYTAMGGVALVSKKTGLSANSLYLAKSRGEFSRPSKYELMKLASSKGYELEEDLFSKG